MKGDENTAMEQETRTKYLKEVERQLLAAGFTAEPKNENLLQVMLDGTPLCRINYISGFGYFQEDVAGRETALEQARTIACTTKEYMNLLEQSPPLTADGLGDGFKLLSEFNGTVLGGKMTKYGAQFITWEWVHNHTSLWQGHFYGPGGGARDYNAAKRDFTTRSGLIQKSALFQPEQLAEVYRSIHETLDSGYPLTDERRKLLEEAARQIEDCVPDLDEQVDLSNVEELNLGSRQIHEKGGMQFS